MLRTNQRPTQEMTLSSFRNGKTLEVVGNFPGGTRAIGLSNKFYADSPRDIGVWALVGSQAPADYPRQRLGHVPRHSEISLQDYMKKAREAIAELLKREQRAEQVEIYQEALAWLAENRKKYAGQWIALRGAELLASGTNAREVYAQVRGMKPSALILKIEREHLPFAGW